MIIFSTVFKWYNDRQQFTVQEREVLNVVDDVCMDINKIKGRRVTKIVRYNPRIITLAKHIFASEITSICSSYGIVRQIKQTFSRPDNVCLVLWNGVDRLPNSQEYTKVSQEILKKRGFY